MIESYQETVDELKRTLTPEQQKMLSLRSVQNFLYSFDKLSTYKREVHELLFQYFDDIKEHGYILDRKQSNRVAFDYIMKIGSRYTHELGFRMQQNYLYTFGIGLHADLLLLLIGILKKVYYLPIVTIIMYTRFLYIRYRYEKRNMVFNIRY
ncbi:MAG: hypothetical protein J0I41_19655 [Filimonas sp.]|nr:hypothetical protein [Filimonas sp.]